jgi:V/A-type H+-transporting ATPase subunit E
LSGEQKRIDQMVEDILANAKLEANKNIGETKSQTQEILDKGKTVAQKEKEELIETQTKSILEQEKQQISSINLQARREILQKKEEEIAKAFDLAKKALLNFNKKEAYNKVLAALIVEAGTAIGGGNLLIKFRKEDKSKVKDLAALAKKITTNSGNKTTLKPHKQTITAMGGIVVQTDDESISIDNTFDARLEQKYKTIRNKIALTLFDEKAS